ncbi:type IV pilus biogenesis/stability protein PilW [Pseudaeromonas sp. ZJS20]|uniref:type IV pilus biogenesis/stability protein PilW n=1 Tax=Pseudaeromonas aegiceratis TaxID=3153928 RepID=UPI00390C6D47
MKTNTLLAWAVLALLPGCVTETTYIGNNSTRSAQSINNVAAAKTRVELAVGYMKKGDMSQAKFNLDKALKMDPHNADAYLTLAYYYQKVGDLKAADETYRKLLSLHSADANAMNNYGVFLCKQKRYDDAERQFLKAVKQPDYVDMDDTFENAGYCAKQAGQKEKALQYFDQAVRYNPRKGHSWLAKAGLELDTNQREAAGVSLSRYAQLGLPETAESLWLRLRLAQELGELAQLHKFGGELVRRFPDSAQAKRYINNDY